MTVPFLQHPGASEILLPRERRPTGDEHLKIREEKKTKNLTNQIIKSMDWFVTSLLILEAQF